VAAGDEASNQNLVALRDPADGRAYSRTALAPGAW